MRTFQMMFSTLGTRGRRFVPSDVHFGYWLMAWLYQLVGGRTGPGCSLLLPNLTKIIDFASIIASLNKSRKMTTTFQSLGSTLERVN